MINYDHYVLSAFVEVREMHAIDQEYLTVDEAAALLRVASSTIRRWIRQGDIPAYRIGKRRVALRRADVDTMIAPARSDKKAGHYVIHTDPSEIRNLTPEEVRRGLEAMERLLQLRKEIMTQRGGKPLRPSLEIIREMREEHMRELG